VKIVEQLEQLDWNCVAASLAADGYAALPRLLTAQESEALISLYSHPELFRSRIEMSRFKFGRGEYQYFRYPLPPLVETLRQALYPRLMPIAQAWARQLQIDPFPKTLEALLETCRRHGQTRPTPLLLRYGPGDFNCLHQDIYGEIAFPFQVVFFLSQPGRDYSGGEFLLVENAPRAQAMGRSLQPGQGEALIITTRYRPAAGRRGTYKVGVRHGVSPVRTGSRWTLGIIFHDAK
jgi:hypothetical protein